MLCLPLEPLSPRHRRGKHFSPGTSSHKIVGFKLHWRNDHARSAKDPPDDGCRHLPYRWDPRPLSKLQRHRGRHRNFPDPLLLGPNRHMVLATMVESDVAAVTRWEKPSPRESGGKGPVTHPR